MPGPLLALAPLLMNDRFRSQSQLSPATSTIVLLIGSGISSRKDKKPTNNPIPSSVSLWKKPTELEII